MNVDRDAFGDAISLIQDHGYDDHSPVPELLARLAWKSFGFGLDLGFTPDGPELALPETDRMRHLRARLDAFHGIFLERPCQDALTETARTRNITKLGAAVQLHVARYLADEGVDHDTIDRHRRSHAVTLSTFCLCSSLRMLERDRALAEIYWHEVCRTRGDASES